MINCSTVVVVAAAVTAVAAAVDFPPVVCLLSPPHPPQVVLCGGSAKIPKLQQMIQDLFPEVEMLSSIAPDEVIPVGAALQAGILVGKDSLPIGEDSITVDCCAKDITVKVCSGLFSFNCCCCWCVSLTPSSHRDTIHSQS